MKVKKVKIPPFPYFKLKTNVKLLIRKLSQNKFAFLTSEDNLKYFKIPMICEEKLDTYL